MKHASATDRRTPSANPRQPALAQPESREAHRPFDYGGGYRSRSGYSAGRRYYADLPGRGLFHCG